MMRTLIMAAALIAASTGAGLAQDVAKGANSFKKCSHNIGPGAQNKIGPELNGLDGPQAGTVANYSYSDANKNSGIVWGEATFKEYIKGPRAKIPNTKMALSASRMSRRSATCGPISSSLTPTVISKSSTNQFQQDHGPGTSPDPACLGGRNNSSAPSGP